MPKVDRCVVRVAAYGRAGIGNRERHNERKNENYANTDIEQDRKHLNVHFKKPDGAYVEVFDKMLNDGEISTRGLKADAKIFDELVFDVNSEYFEQNGGYEYAKQFYAEAYQMAVKEAGGEQNIISAVMHADERNKALSEKLGHDVYHYHLHVVSVPVVEKEIKYTKRCKDKELIGQTKEIVNQVSHSKKWASEKALDEQGNVIRNENGKAQLINSYSLLQDRYFEHMQQAGYKNFERGERGSTKEHLTVLDYKIQQDKLQIDALQAEIAQAQQRAETLRSTYDKNSDTLTALNESITKKQTQLKGLQKNVGTMNKLASTFGDINAMGKKNLLGKVELSKKDWEDVSELAKEGLLNRAELHRLKTDYERVNQQLDGFKIRLRDIQNETRDYREAAKIQPERIQAELQNIMNENIEQRANKPKTKHIER